MGRITLKGDFRMEAAVAPGVDGKRARTLVRRGTLAVVLLILVSVGLIWFGEPVGGTVPEVAVGTEQGGAGAELTQSAPASLAPAAAGAITSCHGGGIAGDLVAEGNPREVFDAYVALCGGMEARARLAYWREPGSTP